MSPGNHFWGQKDERSKVKVTRNKNSASVGFGTPVSAGFFIFKIDFDLFKKYIWTQNHARVCHMGLEKLKLTCDTYLPR